MGENWINKLSTDLELQPESQSWGMLNSDSDRIEEFLDYYEWNKVENGATDKNEFEALAELIFNSVEDALAMGVLTDEIREGVHKFICDRSSDFPKTFEYWSSLDSEEWKTLTLIEA